MYSEYENSIGTGQVHVYFPEPAGGFPLPKDVTLSREDSVEVGAAAVDAA